MEDQLAWMEARLESARKDPGVRFVILTDGTRPPSLAGAYPKRASGGEATTA